MKAFIVLALVAAAAARSVDVDFLKQKSLLTNNDLMKDRYFNRLQVPQQKNLIGEYFPTSYSDYSDSLISSGIWGQRRVTVFSFEEIVGTPLFREYYNIPLFRMYLENYPTVFRRYIESVLFQQFWTVPEFQQYFRNPILFYKYIVPQVQIVAKTQYMPTYDMDVNDVSDLYYNYNKNVYPMRREVVVGDYLNKILKHVYGYDTEVSTPYSYSPYYRYLYGVRDNVFGYNKMPVTYYKSLMDKIYEHLFLNKVRDVTDIKTDVQVVPVEKKVVIDPITGEKVVVDEPKVVDLKVKENVIPEVVDDVKEDQLKEVLLKRLLVTKKISPELYTVLKTLPITHVVEIVRKIVGEYSSVPTLDRDLLERITRVRSPMTVNSVDRQIFDMVHRPESISVMDKDVVTGDVSSVQDLLKVIDHNIVV